MRVAFVTVGDTERLTGGYLYNARVLLGLRENGVEIEEIVPFGVQTGRPIRFDGLFHPVASNLTMAEARHSRINAFGIQYEGKTGLSTSEFSWAA